MTDEPKCTCDDGARTVCRELGIEPHYVGCPRYGMAEQPQPWGSFANIITRGDVQARM